jgi:alkylation response protein AidB-like acyl-CoA dehydrogenase
LPRRTETGWRLSSARSIRRGAILKWYAVWARTDEAETRVGIFRARPAFRAHGSSKPGIISARASGSHDIVFDDVVFPLTRGRCLLSGRVADADVTQATIHAIFIAAIYDGAACRRARLADRLLANRVPANLARRWRPARVQEILGGIEARLAVNAD